MHRLARLPRVVQALHGSRYRYGVQAMSLARSFATAQPPSPNDPFANGTNTYYVEEMYRLWRQDPKSVHASWDVYFSGMDKGLPSFKAFQPPPNLVPAPTDGAPALHASGGAELDDHLKVRSFRRVNTWLVLIDAAGATPRSRLPSTRSPRCRFRPPRYSRPRFEPCAPA